MLVKMTKNTQTNLISFECDEDGQIIRDFIESELQEDAFRTAQLIQKLADPDQQEFEETGNLFELSVQENTFHIEHLFDETEEIHGARDFLRGILNKWQKLTF